MNKGNNEYYKKGYHQMALKGDVILESFIVKWIEPLELTPTEKHYLRQFLGSNKFLATFDKGFKFKKRKGNTRGPVFTQDGPLGDMTEARICFLYDNYGEKAVERYFFKNLRQYCRDNNIII